VDGDRKNGRVPVRLERHPDADGSGHGPRRVSRSTGLRVLGSPPSSYTYRWWLVPKIAKSGIDPSDGT
jgi:hypothetical protein